MVIISTVGTSVFTNIKNKKVKQILGDNIDNIIDTFEDFYEQNMTADDYNEEDFKELEVNVQKYWLQGICKKENRYQLKDDCINDSASAEIKSVVKIIDDKDNNKLKLYLLTTDTALSYSAAKLIKYYFENFKNLSDIEIKKITGLSIDDPKQFEQAGFENLIKEIDKIYKTHKDDRIILNISGGYKALIPFLTIYAQLKDLPIAYIYEDSDKVIEIKNLPLDFDMVFVELMKPFLAKYYISEEQRLGSLLKLIFENEDNIKFENDKYISNDEIINQTLEDVPKEKHQLAYTLIKYNLIKRDENQYSLSYIAKLINQINAGQEKGYIMELLLHKYFSGKQKDGLVKDYTINNDFALRHKFYSVENGKVIISQNSGTRKIGDIDITLYNGNTIVLGEIKAFSAASGYHDKINTNKDYYYQLKARVLAAREIEKDKPIELLLFVFRFVIKNLNDKDSFTESLHFQKVAQRLYQLNEDNDLKNFSFKIIGIKIPIEFNNGNFDFTNFYKGKTNSWKWENIILNIN